jgi:hypothetical protein
MLTLFNRFSASSEFDTLQKTNIIPIYYFRIKVAEK